MIIFVTGASILLNINKGKNSKPAQVQKINIPQAEEKSVPQATVGPTKKEEKKEEAMPTPKAVSNAKKLPETGFPVVQTTIALAALGVVGVKLFSFSGRSWNK